MPEAVISREAVVLLDVPEWERPAAIGMADIGAAIIGMAAIGTAMGTFITALFLSAASVSQAGGAGVGAVTVILTGVTLIMDIIITVTATHTATDMGMDIPPTDTAMGMATITRIVLRPNQRSQSYSADSRGLAIIAVRLTESSGPRRGGQSGRMRLTTVTQTRVNVFV